jgi:hypothetical protein
LTNPLQAAVRILRDAGNALDRRPWLFFVLLAAALAIGIEVRLNFPVDTPVQEQFTRLNPDSKLYYGLARNLSDGTGYHDTVRKKDVLPPVGHPLLLALVSEGLGLSPARQAWLSIWLSVICLILATHLYSRSRLCVLIAAGLYAAYLREVTWLAGGVETSIVLASMLLVLALAVFYRLGFRLAPAVVAGVALAASLLMRPIHVHAVHAATGVALVAFILQCRRVGVARVPRVITGWLVLLMTAQILLGVISVYSKARYGDSRLVSGSYGSWALYVANNEYIPPTRCT